MGFGPGAHSCVGNLRYSYVRDLKQYIAGVGRGVSIVDEYETEAAAPVKDEERDALARYFQLLIARLTNNEEIDEEAQREMAREAAINENRIDDIANFLNQWGNE